MNIAKNATIDAIKPILPGLKLEAEFFSFIQSRYIAAVTPNGNEKQLSPHIAKFIIGKSAKHTENK